MKKTPVAVIGFLREKVLAETLHNLSLADGVLERDVYVYLSAPRNEADKPKTMAVRKVVEEFKRTTLPNITIVLRDKNEGASKNIRYAVTATLQKKEGRVIVLEDDILVSRTLLRYMDAALEYYKDDERVWGVNAFKSPYMPIPKRYPFDVYLMPGCSSWGWATWRDRWEKVDFEKTDWLEARKDHEIFARVSGAGCSLVGIMDRAAKDINVSWDGLCCYHIARNGLYNVAPRHSLTKTVGVGAVGAVNNHHPHGVYAKQKYYNFTPRLTPASELLTQVNRLSKYFPYACSERRPFHKLVRLIVRAIRTYIGPMNNEPVNL